MNRNLVPPSTILPRLPVASTRSRLLALTLVATLAGCGRGGTLLAPLNGASSGAPVAHRPAAAAASQASASASEINGPTVITEPGTYRVAQDFSATGDGIVIQANDVQLFLGDHTITGPGNKVGRAIVVDGVKNASISGGTLRTFGIGVALLGASGSSVRDVTVEGGDEAAAPPANPPQIGLLLVNSWRNTLTGNELSRVNLGLFVRGGGSFENRVQQNIVTAGNNGLLGICYNPAMEEGAAGPTGDKVTNNLLDGFGTGIQTSAGSAANRFTANRIRFLDLAWNDFNGTNVFLGNRTEDLTP